jgi:dethiobiotin synthetase
VSSARDAGRNLRGCFVTGTDTGVGKTVLAAAITAAARRRGIDVGALKPVITGLDETGSPDWPPDHELLARVAGASADDVAILRYGPPVSPHLAAELACLPIDPAALEAQICAAAHPRQLVVVEGVGGLLVPLAEGYDVRTLSRSLGLPLIIAARPGLGTINHTLLTLAAARAAGLEVEAVVLTPWPARPTTIERSNRSTIAALGEVEVEVLPEIARGEPRRLAEAAESLPLERWFAAWLGRDGSEQALGESALALGESALTLGESALALAGPTEPPNSL